MFDPDMWMNVAACDTVDGDTLRWLYRNAYGKDGTVRLTRAVVFHPACPADVIGDALDHPRPEVRAAALVTADLPAEEVVERVRAESHQEALQDLTRQAEHPEVIRALIDRLADNHHPSRLGLLIQNPHLPEEMEERFAPLAVRATAYAGTGTLSNDLVRWLESRPYVMRHVVDELGDTLGEPGYLQVLHLACTVLTLPDESYRRIVTLIGQHLAGEQTWAEMLEPLSTNLAAIRAAYLQLRPLVAIEYGDDAARELDHLKNQVDTDPQLRKALDTVRDPDGGHELADAVTYLLHTLQESSQALLPLVTWRHSTPEILVPVLLRQWFTTTVVAEAVLRRWGTSRTGNLYRDMLVVLAAVDKGELVGPLVSDQKAALEGLLRHPEVDEDWVRRRVMQRALQDPTITDDALISQVPWEMMVKYRPEATMSALREAGVCGPDDLDVLIQFGAGLDVPLPELAATVAAAVEP